MWENESLNRCSKSMHDQWGSVDQIQLGGVCFQAVDFFNSQAAPMVHRRSIKVRVPAEMKRCSRALRGTFAGEWSGIRKGAPIFDSATAVRGCGGGNRCKIYQHQHRLHMMRIIPVIMLRNAALSSVTADELNVSSSLRR